MNRFLSYFALLLLLFPLPLSSQATPNVPNVFTFAGDTCEWVSGGREWRMESCCTLQVQSYTPEQLAYYLMGLGTLVTQDGTRSVGFAFSSGRLSEELKVGAYPRAGMALLPIPGFEPGPGLQIHDGDFSSGAFAILDLALDRTVSPPRIQRFAVEFQQRVSGNAPTLVGHIYFNYSPPIWLELSPAAVVGGDISVATISLRGPTSTKDTIVKISSTDGSLTLPSSVIIPAGLRDVSVPIATNRVTKTTRPIIVAEVDGVAHARTLTLRPFVEPVTVLELWGDDGDFVLGDRHVKYVSGVDGCLHFRENDVDPSTGFARHISFYWRGNSSYWNLTFKNDPPIQPGEYEGARRAGFSNGAPGLDVGGSPTSPTSGRGCNTLTGRFEVLNVTREPRFAVFQLTSFAASFEQHCTETPAALRGYVLYNYEAPIRRRPVRP